MLRTFLAGKIHRATVTQADINYVGSITIDADLLAAANISTGEQVHVVDINNGTRLVTYVIEGPAGSGTVGINGAAARLVHPGDLIIIIAYAQLSLDEQINFVPRVVHVDTNNRIHHLGSDLAAD